MLSNMRRFAHMLPFKFHIFCIVFNFLTSYVDFGMCYVWRNYPYSQIGFTSSGQDNAVGPDANRIASDSYIDHAAFVSKNQRISFMAELYQNKRSGKSQDPRMGDSFDDDQSLGQRFVNHDCVPSYQSDPSESEVSRRKLTKKYDPGPALMRQNWQISKLFPQLLHYSEKLPFNKYGHQCSLQPPEVFPNCHMLHRYRSHDGSCNNLINGKWGGANQPYSRLAKPAYDDGEESPRTVSDIVENGRKSPLPGPRTVSVAISQSVPLPHRVANIMLPFFGQLVANDISLTPSFHIGNRQPDCCALNLDCTVSECFQFSIPVNDPLYGPFNITCHQFARSEPQLDYTCRTGVREQFSAVTHWLDASFLYGSGDEQNRAIRNLYNGQLSFRDLVTGIHNYQHAELFSQILPSLTGDDTVKQCRSSDGRRSCFLAGDERVNQQPLIASLHTVFLRYHNMVALFLAARFPHWSDETIFQETRKFVIASYQVIVFKEFLPVLLGAQVSNNALYKQAGLELLDTGYFGGYDVSANPNVLNEFTTAAFRLHTLVDESVPRLILVTGLAEDIPLSTQFNNHSLLYEEGNADAIINGMLEEMALAFDGQITGELQGRLFRGRRPFGLDLMAIDIQRGRDHGIATYNDIREACGYSRATDFQQLTDFMPTRNVQTLLSIYKNVDDIDLVVGGLLENLVNEDASVGPTFACIIALEFRNKRFADRLWHENPDQYRPAQLNVLRKVTMSQLLCQTTALRHVPKNAFLLVSETNPLVPCNMIPEFNMDKFFDQFHYHDTGFNSVF